MKHTKLDPKLELNHKVTAMEFIYKAVCVGCVLREGNCKTFNHGDLWTCYNSCWHFHKATVAIKKVLDKYDK